MDEEIPLHDLVGGEVDKRKLNKLVDDGVISAEELANAPIHDTSECCGGDLQGVGLIPSNPDHFICSICKQPCEGTTKW